METKVTDDDTRPAAAMVNRRSHGATAALGPEQRKSALQRLANDAFDILVIGGGVTGCGIAVDAVSRGLTVALVEKRDWAAGTSSRSSKLIHGGLRYLERLDIPLVREALHERRLLAQRIAPHLVRPIPFLLPIRQRTWSRVYLGAGLLLYDALAGLRPAMPRHRHLSRAQCMETAPGLRDDVCAGGIRFFDAQVDDARFTLGLVRTAAALGAICASRIAVTELLRRDSRVTGARAVDLESGETLAIQARTTINATGAWATETERLANVRPRGAMRPSKGVHILVPKERIHSRSALVLPTERSVLFVLPWADQWIIGTTDTEWHGDLDHPTITRADVRYLLEHANAVLKDRLDLEDITAAYVGVRPLVGRANHETVTMSRRHSVWVSAPGLVSIAGGKFTTYRLMARDAVDAAARDLPFAVDQSRTADLPLLGATGLSSASFRLVNHAGAAGLSAMQLQRLTARFGTLAAQVLDLVAAEPQLALPLAGAKGYLAAEIRYAVEYEGALHLDDVLMRRTHIAIEERDQGDRAAASAAHLMAPVLSWDRSRVESEITRYRECRARERASWASFTPAAPRSSGAQSSTRDPARYPTNPL